MIKLDVQNCCGCTACQNICPRQAITMYPDEKGFLYPDINQHLCIDCAMCERVCPIHKKFCLTESLPEPDVYAVKHRLDDVRMNSSSGGMFTAISDYVLNKGGIVYGAAFDENFAVCHKRAITREERDKFRGSKYVQSNLKHTFQEVKADLESDRYVLFSGTPCQTAGLYSFLKKQVSMDKLYVCDLVCHGTPSPKVFKDYTSYLQKKFHSEISKITFRYKPMGWRSQAIAVFFKNKKKFIASASEDIFYKLFLPNVILRDSCYDCKYTNLHRQSDITIGDLWGIENSMPEFEDKKGVSLVLVNTTKGQKIFNEIKENINFKKSNIEDCMQLNLKQPSSPSPRTQQFWADYQKRGFNFVVRRYTNGGMKGLLKKLLKKLGLFNIAKKLINGNVSV